LLSLFAAHIFEWKGYDKMAGRPVYQFYAELDDYEPRIWRRFQITSSASMAQLGYVLMTMFEMQARHLYAFEVPKGKNFREHMSEKFSEDDEVAEIVKDAMPKLDEIYRFEMPNNEDNFAEEDDRYVVLDVIESKISRAVSMPKERMGFNYDFGDNWWISMILEDVIVDRELPGKDLPRVLAGAGYGIIEDCGGTPGLSELARAFKKKKGKEYNEFREWLGIENLDLSAFDIDDMNFRLKKVPRIYADICERNLEPTKRSIDLLERKYLKS
jgi:hypothetical protein